MFNVRGSIVDGCDSWVGRGVWLVAAGMTVLGAASSCSDQGISCAQDSVCQPSCTDDPDCRDRLPGNADASSWFTDGAGDGSTPYTEAGRSRVNSSPDGSDLTASGAGAQDDAGWPLGAGGNPAPGAGGNPAPGAGGNPAPGAGGNPAPGASGNANSGPGGSDTSGSGGGGPTPNAGAGGDFGSIGPIGAGGILSRGGGGSGGADVPQAGGNPSHGGVGGGPFSHADAAFGFGGLSVALEGGVPGPRGGFTFYFDGGATLPTRDAAFPTRDAAFPTRDATVPTRDATVPTRDATVPTRDATLPAVDSGRIRREAGVGPGGSFGSGGSPTDMDASPGDPDGNVCVQAEDCAAGEFCYLSRCALSVPYGPCGAGQECPAGTRCTVVASGSACTASCGNPCPPPPNGYPTPECIQNILCGIACSVSVPCPEGMLCEEGLGMCIWPSE